jgi:xanthosine utilization system XapX-like protein
LVVLLLTELVATIPSPGVVAFVGLDGLEVKAAVINPIL